MAAPSRVCSAMQLIGKDQYDTVCVDTHPGILQHRVGTAGPGLRAG